VQVFVQTDGAPANRSGSFNLSVSTPAPTPVALGQRISTTLTADAYAAYQFEITNPGRHLLCYQHAGPVRRAGFERHVDTVVWGPSATTPRYEGDIVPDSSDRTEFVDVLRAGRHALTLYTRLASIDVSARLLRLPEPLDIGVGAATTAAALAPCERVEHRFAASAGQVLTATVNAGFAGRVQVRKLGADGTPGAVIGPTSAALVAGTPRVVSFTIPSTASFGTGDYAIEIDADGEAAGAYSVGLASP
jgi:hypothetical protein